VGGGAIGNLVDRMIFGKVTDFIVWKIVLKNDHAWAEKGLHEWTAFNIADVALCIGVGLMLLDMVIAWWAARKAQHAQAPVAKAYHRVPHPVHAAAWRTGGRVPQL